MAFGLFSGGATGRSSIGSLTEGADMSLSQVAKNQKAKWVNISEKLPFISRMT